MTVWKASDVNGLDSIVTRVAVRCRFDYFVENCGVSWVALENFKSEVSQSRASQMFLGLVQQGVDARAAVRITAADFLFREVPDSPLRKSWRWATKREPNAAGAVPGSELSKLAWRRQV